MAIVRSYLGELVPKETLTHMPTGDTCHLLGFMVQGEDNRGTCTAAGLSVPPSPSFPPFLRQISFMSGGYKKYTVRKLKESNKLLTRLRDIIPIWWVKLILSFKYLPKQLWIILVIERRISTQTINIHQWLLLYYVTTNVMEASKFTIKINIITNW